MTTTRSASVWIATRRARSLRAALSAKTVLATPISHSLPSGTNWDLYLPGTGCLFSIIAGRLKCVNLRDGREIGSQNLPANFNKRSLLHGSLAGVGRILLAYAYEIHEDGKRLWCIDIHEVLFNYGYGGEVIATFQLVKQFSLPSTILQGISCFNVLQMENNYLVVSSGWSSKAFVVAEWNEGKFVVHRCLKAYKTFAWRLLDSRLFIVFDDGDVSVVSIPLLFASMDTTNERTSVIQLPLIPVTGEVSFIRQDWKNTLVIMLNKKKGGCNESSRSTLSNANAYFDSEAGIEFTSGVCRIPGQMQNDLDRHIMLHRGQWSMVMEDLRMMRFWILRPDRTYRSIRIRLAQPVVSVVEFDGQIGMLAVKEDDSALRIYWVV
ncbi:hypothetical protein FRC17_009506 [Serendipita sp. 399]|nr:hypothetical protein FRC17_009506 [Serendipita sp. 399]